MQSAAAGVLAQAPRSLVKGARIEKTIDAPFDAVFQTLTRPDCFMSLRKSVSQVIQQDDHKSYAVKETFMGAQAEFIISVYPYYDKSLVHHSGKAPYFCVDASIDFTVTKLTDTSTHVTLDYSFVMPSLLASFAKKIVAQDRRAQLDAVAQFAEGNPSISVTTPSTNLDIPPLNTDNVSVSKKKGKKNKDKDNCGNNTSANTTGVGSVIVPDTIGATNEKLQALTIESAAQPTPPPAVVAAPAVVINKE